jgi:hypothetical protein
VRRGVVPASLAATRDLRALVNWPGLLELLEREGVASVPTDGVRYWLARLGPELQARLAAAAVLCGEMSVHHIIARSARGIDHPLNYFLIDKGPNSAMGSRVEGFRGELAAQALVAGLMLFKRLGRKCCKHASVAAYDSLSARLAVHPAPLFCCRCCWSQAAHARHCGRASV